MIEGKQGQHIVKAVFGKETVKAVGGTAQGVQLTEESKKRKDPKQQNQGATAKLITV